jgi:hypothetical protein
MSATPVTRCLGPLPLALGQAPQPALPVLPRIECLADSPRRHQMLSPQWHRLPVADKEQQCDNQQQSEYNCPQTWCVFHEPPPDRAGSIHTPGRSFRKVQNSWSLHHARHERWELLRDPVARPQGNCTGCSVALHCGGARCIARYDNRATPIHPDLRAGDSMCRTETKRGFWIGKETTA